MTLPFENDTRRIVKKLAKTSLASEKRRSLLICCTITFAVALMAGLCFVAAAQKAKVESDVRGQYQAMVVPVTGDKAESLGNQPEVERWGLSKSYPFSRYRDSVLSISYADTNWMDLGNKPEFKGQKPKKENEILVERAFLNYFNLPQEAGQTVMLNLGYGEQAYTVTGILEEENTSRMFEVIVSKAFVTANSKGSPEFEFLMRYRGGSQMDAGRLKAQILTFLAAQGILEHEVIFSDNYFNMEGFRSNAGGYLLPAAAVILFACGAVIYNIFYISVMAKVKEYGRLKVIGATPGQLGRIVRYESIYLSMLGIPAGILLGGVAAFVGMPSHWSWADNLKGAVIVAAVTELMIFLSTFTPVRIAERVSPIEAVRFSPYSSGAGRANVNRAHRKITPYVLAGMNFMRSRRKAMVTLVSLSLSGILLLTAATLFRSINLDFMVDKIMGDGCSYTISWQDAVAMEDIPELALENPLSDTLREQILALPGVDAITSYGATTAEIALPRKSDSFTILSLTQEQFKKLLPADRIAAGTADYDSLVANGGILISDSMDRVLSRYDYTPQIGDTLHLKTYGGQDMDFNVMGIVKEGGREATGVVAALFILPEEALNKLYPQTQSFQMVWNVHTTGDSGPLREQLFKILNDPALSVLARSDLMATLKPSMRQTVVLCYLFTVFLFIFALVNLSNTLMTNLSTRRQELGILQSVGMTQGQLLKMLSGECLCYIAGALGLTIVIGGGLGAAVVKIINQLKLLGNLALSYGFPFLELAVFICALITVHCIYVFASAHYMRRQPAVALIRAAD